MKQKFIDAYMKTAEVFAELSTARRNALVKNANRLF